MVRSSRDDMTKESKHDSPKFSNLLHAASHSFGEKDSTNTWLSENPSTSETDYGDEHDGDEEDAAVEEPLNVNNADNVCRSPGCRKAARSRGRCPTHGGGTHCNIQGCMKYVVSGGLCVGHGGGRRCLNKAAASMWLPVGYVGHTEVDGVVKFQIARVVPKAEVCATFMEAEDVVNA
ncbi:unnamed protein product [Peronospora destructor]|uniref:Uncharacterized protein n=1 Tax=Peronospora destructor TaxID=86335 RepID=A0AAV0VAZ1_9STRA|nr:unnamed protein product [Peronospora destructor]